MRQIPRLFVDERLEAGAEFPLADRHIHYLATVLRLQPGAELRLLDDATGEWAAVVVEAGRKRVVARVGAMIRGRETVPDLWLLTAPIRAERFEWIVEKATELGVARIVPVLTERVNHGRLKPERLRAHMVEAAEQCGRTALPDLAEAVKLSSLLAGWPPERALFFADEEGGEPMGALKPATPAAILIGPEGGFSPAEREALLKLAPVRRLALGPRILRADTAVVAAIAQFQLFGGD
ncbi:16S rRNA (uracil(1498)-N(3))-methyltransferase [Sandaracinobacter sp. RS1-74]|uniref:16S rRNA (uracil(1498)-N(3))-methyltransferase n=1 Tax=Sandaracinobacteroides sayramensis TaxID=2913411 RepID=UPI001EDBEFCD|nr:16S rRNA (uracil(1498)-N(3))-methyltransferase [Sandaracinobacteroides sayramensis]MCG2841065.1 16S rRNA (uracil(1498)-N(3))-methyltransferase [Sandaracinobacteroides sayramensis]